jgi:outer membrane protein
MMRGTSAWLIHGSWAAALLSLALGVAPARAQAPARVLTLEQCIELSRAHSPDLVFAREEVAATLAARNSVRGNFGPKLRVEGNLLRWDGPLALDFGSIPGLPISIPPFQVRDPTTASLTLSFIQPLTSIWTIYEGYKAQDLGVDVAKVKREVARRDLAFQVTEAFFRVVQATRLAEIAQQSVTQLQAQVERAKSFFKHGVVAHNDVLRAELGLAAARQQLIQAKSTVTLAQSRLAFTMGLPPETLITPAGVPAGVPARVALAIGEAEHRALARRVEIREIDTRIAQAERGVRAAWSKLLPQVAFVASYQLNSGSSFTPEKAYFFGLSASWDFWEWGATFYGTREARARKRQVVALREKVRDGIRLETRAAHVNQATAAEAIALARQAVDQAQENFRLEAKRYEARANTSFDVLDAETQLTQTRARLETANIEYLIARAALARAIGDEIGFSAIAPSPKDGSVEAPHAAP